MVNLLFHHLITFQPMIFSSSYGSSTFQRLPIFYSFSLKQSRFHIYIVLHYKHKSWYEAAFQYKLFTVDNGQINLEVVRSLALIIGLATTIYLQPTVGTSDRCCPSLYFEESQTLPHSRWDASSSPLLGPGHNVSFIVSLKEGMLLPQVRPYQSTSSLPSRCSYGFRP